MGFIARNVRRLLPDRWQPPVRYMYEWTRGLLERELPLAVAAVSPGDRVIDVGANVGIYTHALARAGASVEAFEPQVACASVLRAYASAAGRVRVHQAALGRQAGEAELRIPSIGGRELRGNATLGATAVDHRVEIANVLTL